MIDKRDNPQEIISDSKINNKDSRAVPKKIPIAYFRSRPKRKARLKPAGQ